MPRMAGSRRQPCEERDHPLAVRHRLNDKTWAGLLSRAEKNWVDHRFPGFGAVLPGEGLCWIRRFPAITRIGGEPPGSGNGGLDGYLQPGSPPRVHRSPGYGKGPDSLQVPGHEHPKADLADG